MSTRELIETTFERLKDDCLQEFSGMNVEGYTGDDAFIDSLTHVLLSDKTFLDYKELKDFVLKRMSTTRYYKNKTYNNHKTYNYNALHQKTKEEE